MIKHFNLNTIGNDFVVGDIHGHFDILEERLKLIGFNECTDRLFSVGDLVDRGPKSNECLKWLEKPWFHACKGNHEQMAIDYYSFFLDSSNMIRNGGGWFTGLTRDEQFYYVDEFKQLPLIMEVDTKNGLVGILHAEYLLHTWLHTKDVSKLKSIEQECLWGRYKINYNDTTIVENVHKIYVGHTPVGEVITLGNHVYIDTGCFFTNELTILEI